MGQNKTRIINTNNEGNHILYDNGLPVIMDQAPDKSNVGIHNEILITVDMLPKDINSQLDAFMGDCQKSFFETLKSTRGKVVRKTSSPTILRLGSTSSPEVEGLPTRAEFSKMLNETVHQTLINQSGVLTNTIKSVIKQMMDGSLLGGP